MLLYFSVFTYWINKDCCNAQRFQFSPKTIAVKCRIILPRKFPVDYCGQVIMTALVFCLYKLAAFTDDMVDRLGFFPTHSAQRRNFLPVKFSLNQICSRA